MKTFNGSPSSQVSRLALARGHLDAVFAILLSPTARPQHSVVHIVRFWRVLARIAGDDVASSEDSLPASIRSGRVAWVPEAQRAATADFVERLLAVDGLEAWEAVREPGASSLLAHAQQAAEVLNRAERERAAQPFLSRMLANRRRLWLGVSGLLTIIVLAFMGPWRQSRFDRPWRAAFYPSEDFAGRPVARWHERLDFDWSLEPPLPGMSRDRFSVRWDTCLVMEQGRVVAFQLTSNDGSRLYVDGTLIIENWGVHERRARGVQIELAAGVYHLRVDYFDHKGPANATLSASLDGEPPRPITGEWLRPPKGSVGDRDPCGS